MKSTLRSLYFPFLPFFLVLVISCSGQDPYEQQFNNMVGEWVVISADKDGMDTLEFLETSEYLLKSGSVEEWGKWKILGLQYLEIGADKYRFFFSRKNLILEDADGDQFELVNRKTGNPEVQAVLRSDTLISPFVRRIFQDHRGDLWFGTNGDGVARYDGDSLEYFSVNEGFGGYAVRGVVGDKEGNVWFGSEGGLTKYDGASFINYTEKDGLVHNDVWSLFIDSKGTIWVGTLEGVSQFDGDTFTPFDLPETEPDSTRGVTSAKIVHSIMEDSDGKMWFGTNGGAYIYDGKSLSNISEKDGLCNNAVNCILEDKTGTIWFATHHRGICRWDGTSFTHITEEDGVQGTETWDLYEDRSGNIWFPVENFGVYRYDGHTFTNFREKDGLITNAIQCTFEDKDGRLWLGGWKGLFRYDGNTIFQVSRNGPWQ